MPEILKPNAGKLVYLLIGAVLVAYTGIGKFLPSKG